MKEVILTLQIAFLLARVLAQEELVDVFHIFIYIVTLIVLLAETNDPIKNIVHLFFSLTLIDSHLARVRVSSLVGAAWRRSSVSSRAQRDSAASSA